MSHWNILEYLVLSHLFALLNCSLSYIRDVISDTLSRALVDNSLVLIRLPWLPCSEINHL